MTETRVGFLYNAASCFSSPENRSHKLLRSYYLTRCSEISKTADLPEKYFSSKIRCSHCFIEWNKETETKVRPLKLSKQQRRRLRLKAIKDQDPSLEQKLSYNKELVQICSFCKNSTITPLKRVKRNRQAIILKENQRSSEKSKVSAKKAGAIHTKPQAHITEINVYANSKDIFSLKNKDNTLLNKVNQAPKIIKNNKKKKDKFAGLCQQAVIATAKLKEEQKKQNKLNLFLKPSS